MLLIMIINERSLEEVANILMANLHSLKAGKKEVTLEDIYKDKPIIIKLNPNLTPQKNAENYYRKSKNKRRGILVRNSRAVWVI